MPSKLLDFEEQFGFYVNARGLYRITLLSANPALSPTQAAYHTNLVRLALGSVRLQTDRVDTLQINVLIHIPCVPTILFTALVLVHHFDWASYSLLDIALGGGHVLNVTFPVLVVAGYASYFVLLEPLAGVSLRAALGLAFAVVQEPGCVYNATGHAKICKLNADTLPTAA